MNRKLRGCCNALKKKEIAKFRSKNDDSNDDQRR